MATLYVVKFSIDGEQRLFAAQDVESVAGREELHANIDEGLDAGADPITVTKSD